MPAPPMTKNQSKDILKPPSKGPDMMSLNPGGIGTITGNPPVNAMTTPRHISIVPSVTTKEWMRNRTTSAPLMAPSAAATATAKGAARIGGTP